MSRLTPVLGAATATVMLAAGFTTSVRAQNCAPARVFPTPVLSPAGCTILDYFVQNNHASAQTIAVADFNRDGKFDVVATQSWSVSNELAVQLGNGDGTFQSPTYIYPATCCNPDLRSAVRAIVGDFNGDGKRDIVGLNSGGSTNSFTFLPDNGDGTF